jgi:acetyl esterase
MTDARATPGPGGKPFVRPDVRGFLDYLNGLPGPRTHELAPDAARQVYRATKDVADLPLGDLARVEDLAIPGPAGPIPARLFDAVPRREPGPALVFFHGGGFVIGDLDTHASFCAEMARVLRLPVIAVDYRLAPEHAWPAAPDDAEAAARWVADSPATLGFAVTGLVLCGDSAGGNLAIVTALDLRDRPAAVPVIAQAPIYPLVNMAGDYPSFDDFADGFLLTRDAMMWFADAYAADVAHQRGSPLAADLHGMPPAVIVTASLDPIRDQGRAYAAKLIDAGVPVTFREALGNIHGFVTLRKALPSSQGDVAGFLVALRATITEAEADHVMAQAAGELAREAVDLTSLPYRPCAGIMLVNRDGRVFVGQRLDTMLEAWQMPQGGIDPGEDARAAAIRELGEETGVKPDRIEFIAEAPDELFYDLPPGLVGKVWKGKWRGQRQRWFLFRLVGDDRDIDIATAHPEFRSWRWVDAADLPAMAVPFKKALYQDVLAAFQPQLAAAPPA